MEFDGKCRLARLFAVACVLILALVTNASAWEGKVVGVADGDTVTVLSKNNEQIRVRLYGIDAPESAQAFGARAKQALARMVFGKVVRVEEKDRDRYGRVVARLYVGSVDVNAELVRQGMESASVGREIHPKGWGLPQADLLSRRYTGMK